MKEITAKYIRIIVLKISDNEKILKMGREKKGHIIHRITKKNLDFLWETMQARQWNNIFIPLKTNK